MGKAYQTITARHLGMTARKSGTAAEDARYKKPFPLLTPHKIPADISSKQRKAPRPFSSAHCEIDSRCNPPHTSPRHTAADSEIPDTPRNISNNGPALPQSADKYHGGPAGR